MFRNFQANRGERKVLARNTKRRKDRSKMYERGHWSRDEWDDMVLLTRTHGLGREPECQTVTDDQIDQR